MITLPFIIIFTILAYKFSKQIRRYSVFLFILALLISIVAFLNGNIPFFKPITQGYIGLALFYIVMITGALNKNKLRIELSKVRKEYSILGFILITPHAFKYLLMYLSNDISIPIFGIIVYVIMIPLFITSFTLIRKQFTYQNWKKLQSLSYIVYILLFVHLINVRSTLEPMNVVLYIILFIVYFVLKLKYEMKRRKQ
jgi:DMSO/TMAO reductase YedYZ heme-binding membrane subunit